MVERGGEMSTELVDGEVVCNCDSGGTKGR